MAKCIRTLRFQDGLGGNLAVAQKIFACALLSGIDDLAVQLWLSHLTASGFICTHAAHTSHDQASSSMAIHPPLHWGWLERCTTGSSHSSPWALSSSSGKPPPPILQLPNTFAALSSDAASIAGCCKQSLSPSRQLEWPPAQHKPCMLPLPTVSAALPACLCAAPLAPPPHTYAARTHTGTHTCAQSGNLPCSVLPQHLQHCHRPQK